MIVVKIQNEETHQNYPKLSKFGTIVQCKIIRVELPKGGTTLVPRGKVCHFTVKRSGDRNVPWAISGDRSDTGDLTKDSLLQFNYFTHLKYPLQGKTGKSPNMKYQSWRIPCRQQKHAMTYHVAVFKA